MVLPQCQGHNKLKLFKLYLSASPSFLSGSIMDQTIDSNPGQSELMLWVYMKTAISVLLSFIPTVCSSACINSTHSPAHRISPPKSQHWLLYHFSYLNYFALLAWTFILLKIIISAFGKNSTEYTLWFKRFISNKSLLWKLNEERIISVLSYWNLKLRTLSDLSQSQDTENSQM